MELFMPLGSFTNYGMPSRLIGSQENITVANFIKVDDKLSTGCLTPILHNLRGSKWHLKVLNIIKRVIIAITKVHHLI